MKKMPKLYAVYCLMGDGEYHLAYTWDNKHPEDRVKKSEKVYAIYPTRRQAVQDAIFRGKDACHIKQLHGVPTLLT